MNINLLIKYIDGTEKSVVAIAADIVAFEARFDISVATLEKNVRLTHLMFMAWNIERRTGQTKDEFEKWIETVEIVTADDSKK